MHEDLFTRDQLLRNEGSNGNHGKTPVVELFGLHVLPFGGVRGEETQGVEAQVAGLVVVPQGVEVLGAGSSPPKSNSVGLAKSDGEQQGLPEHGTAGLNLLEVVDGRARDLPVEVVEQRIVLELLLHDESKGSKHGHTAVGNLRLPPPV